MCTNKGDYHLKHDVRNKCDVESLPHEANAKSHAHNWILCVLVALALMPIAARRCLDFLVAAFTVVDVRIDLCMVTDRMLLIVNNRFMPNNNNS